MLLLVNNGTLISGSVKSVIDGGGYKRLGLEVKLGQGEGTLSSSILVMVKTGGHLKEQVVLTSTSDGVMPVGVGVGEQESERC